MSALGDLTVRSGMVREVVVFGVRYAMFRGTIGACAYARWLIEVMPELDEGTRRIIARDLREEFAAMERTPSYREHVAQCDKELWQSVIKASEAIDGEEAGIDEVCLVYHRTAEDFESSHPGEG